MKDEGILERVGDDGPEQEGARKKREGPDGRLDGCSTRLVTGDVDHMLPLAPGAWVAGRGANDGTDNCTRG